MSILTTFFSLTRSVSDKTINLSSMAMATERAFRVELDAT